ncbi:MAG: PilZ domain-containing protein [Clostridiaceae bacterium]|nr:PilZ domain-containing protein [Clostridiaceae bacterium]
MKPAAYSRRFLRIKPDPPVYGEIRIVQIGRRHVLSSHARVRLLDISSGGVRFASVLKLPADSKVVLELSMEFDGRWYRYEGYVVSSLKTEVHEYEYGFCFKHPGTELRQLLLKIFEQISSKRDRYILLRMPKDRSN